MWTPLDAGLDASGRLGDVDAVWTPFGRWTGRFVDAGLDASVDAMLGDSLNAFGRWTGRLVDAGLLDASGRYVGDSLTPLDAGLDDLWTPDAGPDASGR